MPLREKYRALNESIETFPHSENSQVSYTSMDTYGLEKLIENLEEIGFGGVGNYFIRRCYNGDADVAVAELQECLWRWGRAHGMSASNNCDGFIVGGEDGRGPVVECRHNRHNSGKSVIQVTISEPRSAKSYLAGRHFSSRR